MGGGGGGAYSSRRHARAAAPAAAAAAPGHHHRHHYQHQWGTAEAGGDSSRGRGSRGTSSRGSGSGSGGSGKNAAAFQHRNKRRARGTRPPRSREGSESRGVSHHHRHAGFRETGAARRPVHQGGVVAAMGGSGPVTRFGGGGGGGSGWRGDIGYLPAPPCAAGPAPFGNHGGCALGGPSQWPVAACGPFAHQSTAVGEAGYYSKQAGYRGHAWCGGQPG